MKKTIKRFLIIPILLMHIFISNKVLATAPTTEKGFITIEVEGFKPVTIIEDDSKIILESEDEDDDTEIGIDFSVDLGEEDGSFIVVDDTFIEVDGIFIEMDDNLIELDNDFIDLDKDFIKLDSNFIDIEDLIEEDDTVIEVQGEVDIKDQGKETWIIKLLLISIVIALLALILIVIGMKRSILE